MLRAASREEGPPPTGKKKVPSMAVVSRYDQVETNREGVLLLAAIYG